MKQVSDFINEAVSFSGKGLSGKTIKVGSKLVGKNGEKITVTDVETRVASNKFTIDFIYDVEFLDEKGKKVKGKERSTLDSLISVYF